MGKATTFIIHTTKEGKASFCEISKKGKEYGEHLFNKGAKSSYWKRESRTMAYDQVVEKIRTIKNKK